MSCQSLSPQCIFPKNMDKHVQNYKIVGKKERTGLILIQLSKHPKVPPHIKPVLKPNSANNLLPDWERRPPLKQAVM